MEKVKIYYDREGNTLTVWFGEPADEYICEETGDEIIIMKDKNGTVLGFEKLNYLSGSVSDRTVVFETAMV